MFYLFVLFIVLYLCCWTLAADSAADRAALTDLFQATQGSNWNDNTNWTSSVSMCWWTGVMCNCTSSECRVTQLVLNSNYLGGTLPQSLIQLTALTKLDLGNNYLESELPEIDVLTNLTHVDLSSNRFSGCFSLNHLINLEYINYGYNSFQCQFADGNITALSKLRHLDVSGNYLFGTVPTLIASPQLEYLDLSANQLSGTIPTFDHLRNLTGLYLQNNRLTGTIPEFKGSLKLTQLFLNNNQLVGRCPEFSSLVNLRFLSLANNQLVTLAKFETLTQLFYLDLRSNMMIGTIHAFSQLRGLEFLYLQNNSFTGTIPVFSNLSNLTFLWLGMNQLQSTLPSFASNTFLQQIDVSGNQLNGTVQNSFVNLFQLSYLDLSSNYFSGPLPLIFSDSIVELFLNNNTFSGPIPDNFSNNISSTILMDLSFNRLNGTCPEFDNLVNLQSLTMGSNKFYGTIPQFSKLTQLVTIQLNNNYFSGPVPSFSNLSGLVNLYLNSNLLSGSVPDFHAHSELAVLILSDNRLSGTLPAFSTLTKLVKLRVPRNFLEGTIPDFSHMNSTLTRLDLSSNKFTGSIPRSLQQLGKLQYLDVGSNLLSGDVRCFDFSSDAPALAASFVNFSHNKLKRFETFPAVHNVTVLDLRGNDFLCPFPQFPVLPPLVVLRSPCSYDWAALGLYLGIGLAACVAAAILLFILKRLLSERFLKIALFVISWVLGLVSIGANAISYRSMIVYLTSLPNYCLPINYFQSFSGLVSIPSTTDWSGSSVVTSSISTDFPFAVWINSPVWKYFDNYRSMVQNNIASFEQFCQSVSECVYHANSYTCELARPELAGRGGVAYQRFLNAIFVFVSLRLLYELFSLVLILISCMRGSLFGRRVFFQTSVFLPLLLLRQSLRNIFVNDVILMEAQPSDYLWRLLTNGLFNTGPMLAANLYYLLAVVQTGLDASSWASLLLGVLMLPQLIGQAIWSSESAHRKLKEELHYQERAESGISLQLDDISALPPVISRFVN
jgi:Leucine-rich repeat (LRR) protein